MYNRDSNGALRPNRVNEIQTQRKGLKTESGTLTI
jgi:hypothetical protein